MSDDESITQAHIGVCLHSLGNERQENITQEMLQAVYRNSPPIMIPYIYAQGSAVPSPVHSTQGSAVPSPVYRAQQSIAPSPVYRAQQSIAPSPIQQDNIGDIEDREYQECNSYSSLNDCLNDTSRYNSSNSSATGDPFTCNETHAFVTKERLAYLENLERNLSTIVHTKILNLLEKQEATHKNF